MTYSQPRSRSFVIRSITRSGVPVAEPALSFIAIIASAAASPHTPDNRVWTIEQRLMKSASEDPMIALTLAERTIAPKSVPTSRQWPARISDLWANLGIGAEVGVLGVLRGDLQGDLSSYLRRSNPNRIDYYRQT